MNTDGYTKLLSRIVTSSVWVEPHATVRVWITMLALANRDGFVGGSPIGLASVARVELHELVSAMTAFTSPDPYSTTPDNEGRRVAIVEGGWLLLNFAKIRAEVGGESRREYQRQWMAEKRAKARAAVDKSTDAVNACTSVDTNVQQSMLATQAEAEALLRSTAVIPSAVLDRSSSISLLSDSENVVNTPVNTPDENVVNTPDLVVQKGKRATKVCPDDWRPSEKLLQRLSDERVDEALARGGTSILMELERMRSTTFRTARSDWDRVAWNWLLTECKNINQKEALYESRQQARR